MQEVARRFGLATTCSVRPLRVFLSAAVVAASTAGSAPVWANDFGFDYALDEFRMTGNVAFFDDFEDGSRTTPPTSAFVDYRGTVTVEAGGFLVLDSDNGSFPRPDLGQNLEWVEGLVDAPQLVDGGSGASTISASFRPDVPPPGFVDGTMFSHYGIYLGTEGLQGVEITLDQAFSGLLRISFYDNRLFPSAAGRLGTAAVLVSSITGNIVLELVIDHAIDTVLPRYSVDGGATFVDGVDWNLPARPGPVFDVGSEASVSLFAFGAIPEPGTALLLCGGLIGLAAHGRRLRRVG